MPRRASNASTRRQHDPTRTRSSPYDDDDCEICRALRSGDDAKALELMRNHPSNLELQRLMSLSDEEFDAWSKAQGVFDD